MELWAVQNPLVFNSEMLGNLVSFMAFVASMATFYLMLKKKSAEGFRFVPFAVGLLITVLWMYYETLNSNEILLLAIISVGCFVEANYVDIYISNAPKKAKMLALKLLLLLNFVGFGLIVTVTHFLVEGSERVKVLGWICAVLSATICIAPLCITKLVTRRRAVDFMPISLTFAVLLNAMMWFLYGLLLKDSLTMVQVMQVKYTRQVAYSQLAQNIN